MLQALDDLRVVELTAGMAGPWIGRFMAWCGAEVIKIESRRFPDVTRLYVPPWAPEMGIQPELSPWFTDWNAGKRFVALDLTRPAGVELARRIVAQADVVVENYTPGVVDKLGLGYADLARVKPDLVMLSTSGFGGSGPHSRYVTWGPNIEAVAGLSMLSGFPERECTMTHYAYPDSLSGLHGLFAVMCALDHRRRTGEGQHIDLAQLETTVSVVGDVMMELLANGRVPAKRGNSSRHAAPHGCYPCAGEDRWCAISVGSEEEWRRFCAVLGKPEWLSDPRFASLATRLEHAAELEAEISSWTRARLDYEVMSMLQAAGIAAGVAQNTEDQMQRDPQLAARGFFEEIPHRKKGTVRATGIPLGLTGTPGRTSGAGSPLGQDTDYVFGQVLGLSREEIDGLVEAGVIEISDSARTTDR